MKLLTAGHGHDSHSGVRISLRSDHGYDKPELREVLLSYSCYPPAIDKIYQCLRYSGRYDCVVQSTWIARQYLNVLRDLDEIGVTLIASMKRDKYGNFYEDLQSL